MLIADGLRVSSQRKNEYVTKTLLNILHDFLGYRIFAARWIPHEISEEQQWYLYTVAQASLDRYQRNGKDYLGRIVSMDEICAHSYEPNLERQPNQKKHPDPPRPKKVRPT